MQRKKIFNFGLIFLGVILFGFLIYLVIKRDKEFASEYPYIIVQDHHSYRTSKIDSVNETGVYFRDQNGRSILIRGKVVIVKQ